MNASGLMDDYQSLQLNGSSQARWLEVGYHVAIVGLTSSGAVANAVMMMALLGSSSVVSHGSRILANISGAALLLCGSSLALPVVRLLGLPVDHVGCVSTGSVHAAAVLVMALSLVFLVIDECVVVLRSTHSQRRWTDPAFCATSWFLSWALVLPLSMELWGRFRPNDQLGGYCGINGPWSVQLTYEMAAVLLPVVIVSAVYTRLLLHVVSARKACSPKSESSDRPRFLRATFSQNSSQKLQEDLGSMLLVLALVCTFYFGYLPQAIVESFFADDVGCIVARAAYLWWLSFGCWGHFLNLIRYSRYRALCLQLCRRSSSPKKTREGIDEFGM